MNNENRAQGYTPPVGSPTGRKVAVIGLGPVGIGCVEVLAQKGHEITIFESMSAFDGLLAYGRPVQTVLQEKREEFQRAGVKFIPNTYMCKNKTFDEFFEEGFDAVFIDMGLEMDRKMENTPGSELSGVYEASDFLILGNMEPARLLENSRKPLEIGRRVVVIGGGDIASDCLRTALKLGSEDVTCLCCCAENEILDGQKVRKIEREEGAKYRFLTQPVKFIAGSDGRLAAVECVEVKLGDPDAQGCLNPVSVEGSNFSVAADTAVLALGYWIEPILDKTKPGFETSNWVKNKTRNITLREGVFTGGDCDTGSDFAVAVTEGRKTALSIDEYLRNK